MKILLASNAPWLSSGYGQQGASLARRLRDAGHHVTYYANYGLNGGVIDWEGIRILPSNGLGYVDPIIKGHLRYAQPDLLITLQDLWPWRETDFPQTIRQMGIRWAAWFPIDALPVSPGNLAVLTQVDFAITMANFAERELEEKHGIKTTVIPHGVEKEFGFTANGRREFRRHLQVPQDAFLFGSVGRNAYYPGRKGFDRLMRAFTEMPEDCYLYIHATTDSEHGSVPLPQIADFYGIQDRVMFADDYNGVMGYSQNGMNALYSAMDCYVQPTLGEGFGLPVLEAQACGAVVIATDCTSMPELLCPEASQLVPPVTELFTPDPAHRYLIDIPKLVDSMKEIYEIKRDNPDGMRAMKARAGLWANGWDWDRIWTENWVPFLAEAEAEITRNPRHEYHRGNAQVFEHEGRMRKQDSTLRSPAAKKELDVLLSLQDVPGVIPVLDSGQTESGTWWFDMPVMTPLREADLQTLEVDQVLVALRESLTALHERGVAHRDVAPENVVLSPDGAPYLIDFEWAHPCDGEIGVDCVDFEPWKCLDKAVAVMQFGAGERGFHTIVNYLKGLPLDAKTHGYKGVPYQQIDGVGERDCQIRWDIMQPDVAGKRVADVGCNLGWFVRQAVINGAHSAVGYDSDIAAIESAIALTPGYDDDQRHAFSVLDIDRTGGAGALDYDVIFCLSVLQHLQNPDRVWEWMMEHGKEVYVEIPTRFITDRMSRDLAYAEMLGESERGRPIFRVRPSEKPVSEFEGSLVVPV